MRLALITDIHGNREGFEACLEQAHLHGVDQIALLGDFVGYGADPAWVVDRARALVDAGAIAVKGNHDESVVRGAVPGMIEDARRVVEWTQNQLHTDQINFLASLPYTQEWMGCLFVHANAAAPADWAYVTSRAEAVESLQSTSARYVFAGHVHEPRLYHLSGTGKISEFSPTAGVAVPVPSHRQWFALPGSAGQPRDGNPAACWALFDLGRATLTFHRVPYDHDATAAKILAAGLPPRFAERLRQGV